MAQKPVKKPVAKKAPAKKATVKKAATKKVAPEVTAVIMETPCSQGCGCGCRRGGFWRFIGKLLIVVIIFGLGFATAKVCMMKKMHRGMMNGPRVEFVNGCVDLSSIKCPEMVNKIAMADTDANGCVTREEFKVAKRELRKEMRNERGPRGEHRGCDCDNCDRD
ncbi:hypothetical protein LJC18_03825 [Lachnospiraceae bacterium OttesenSCG-928-E19]|nr:hypothetical protein [Lachnospiraceae bacterium OttesenSCG-928-E19]